MRTVDFVPYHLHYKHTWRESSTGHYEQNDYSEENLLQCSYEHLTVGLSQTLKIVTHTSLSFLLFFGQNSLIVYQQTSVYSLSCNRGLVKQSKTLICLTQGTLQGQYRTGGTFTVTNNIFNVHTGIWKYSLNLMYDIILMLIYAHWSGVACAIIKDLLFQSWK